MDKYVSCIGNLPTVYAIYRIFRNMTNLNELSKRCHHRVSQSLKGLVYKCSTEGEMQQGSGLGTEV